MSLRHRSLVAINCPFKVFQRTNYVHVARRLGYITAEECERLETEVRQVGAPLAGVSGISCVRRFITRPAPHTKFLTPSGRLELIRRHGRRAAPIDPPTTNH